MPEGSIHFRINISTAYLIRMWDFVGAPAGNRQSSARGLHQVDNVLGPKIILAHVCVNVACSQLEAKVVRKFYLRLPQY